MNENKGLDQATIDALMNDFYSESDEHLTAAREDLLRLEALGQAGQVEPSLIEDLFRRFHTLKGLAAMVGIRPAEQVAHGVENYLRMLREKKAPLSAGGVSALADGVQELERILAAHKENLPLPDGDAALDQIERLLREAETGVLPAAPLESPPPPSAAGGPSLSEEQLRSLEQAMAAGAACYRFRFRPAPALAERGVNVNSVRDRLGEIGTLIHAEPKVVEGGSVSFEFLVAVTAKEEAFAGWGRDGLEFERVPGDWLEASAGARAGPEQPSGPEIPAPLAAGSPTTLVRVDLGRVDELMRLVGELVISRARLENSLDGVQSLIGRKAFRPIQETGQRMERQLRDLREAVMRLRMVPVSEVFKRMRFVVRDLARDLGRQVALKIEGEDAEVDKFVVERMLDPLLHLVRNAVSHGIEDAAERTAKGKDAIGTVWLQAAASGDQVVIVVSDDGRGLDRERIRRRAGEAGLLAPEEALTDDRLLEILCAPGFSTRNSADRASGRGMGMAVVLETVRELGGTMHLQSEPDRGVRFTIGLPLTLAITDALIVSAGGSRFAVPQGLVQEVIEVHPEMIVSMERNELIRYRGSALKLVRLAWVFGLAEQPRSRRHALILKSGRGPVGLLLDRVLGRREVVVRPLTDSLVRTPGISGATELGDGRAVLILDASVTLLNDRGRAVVESAPQGGST